MFVQRMEKLEKEMKSDMTGAKRDSMRGIFPGQPLTKGEYQKKAALFCTGPGFPSRETVALAVLLLGVRA